MLLDSFDQGSEVIIYVLKGSWGLCLLNRFGLKDQKFSVIHLQFEMPDISSGNIEQAIGYRVWNPRERSEWWHKFGNCQQIDGITFTNVLQSNTFVWKHLGNEGRWGRGPKIEIWGSNVRNQQRRLRRSILWGRKTTRRMRLSKKPREANAERRKE